MSYELILPFFPEELRELLLDLSISDLMINGATGVFADRNGVVERIELRTPYTNARLQAAIERVARILGQDLTSQNPILNTAHIMLPTDVLAQRWCLEPERSCLRSAPQECLRACPRQQRNGHTELRDDQQPSNTPPDRVSRSEHRLR